MLGAALATGKLSAPEDGPLAWTSHSDLAEAAAIVLRRRAATA
jgi:NAD(P)H dehydrogenase (quinone)